MKRQITVVHPSRSRVDLCYKVASLFLNNSSEKNINYFVSIDESDPYKNLYIDKKPNKVCLKMLWSTRRSKLVEKQTSQTCYLTANMFTA